VKDDVLENAEHLGTTGDDEIVLNDRYRLVPDAPLADLGTPGARAYVASDLKSPNELMFVRICEPSIFPRVEAMVQLKNLREAYTVIPEDWGPIYWPPLGRTSFAIVFRRPSNAPVMPTLKTKIQKVDTDTVIKSLLIPALKTLTLFERRKITHRAIRPDNVFESGIDGEIFIFGDCVSVPPAWGQSTIFETIESSMAPAMARGKGTIADDIYALGATMLFLGIGCCPVGGKNDKDLLRAKIEKGSFTALLGDEVVPGGLREPIRGMLSDDPSDRWTLDDLVQWTHGTLRRSARPIRDFKTDRPFKFREIEFRNTRMLAASFGRRWKEAAIEIRGKEFTTWTQRGLTDANLVDNIATAVETVGASDGELGDARLVSKICSYFDPEGPLRFRELVVMPDGIGYALANAVEQGNKPVIAIVTELIQKSIAFEWFEEKILYGRTDLTLEAKNFKRLQQFLRHSGPGYGIERVLYEMNPFLPCRSEMLKTAYVYSLRDLLPALDEIVAKTGQLPVLVDRHIAAFIASRIGGSAESQLSALEHSTGASVSAKIGMTGLLARVQKEYPTQLVPHLTAWLADELASAATRFHSRSTRKKVESLLDQAATTGNVMELHHILSNRNAIKKDERDSKQAKREYNEAVREIKRLESSEFQEEVKRTGWRIAATISVGISLLTTIAVFTW
jgi:hypothetical protein